MTTTTITLPCPNGCNRTVAAEGREVHYCVVRTGKHVEREYIGTIDGEVQARGASYIEVETTLNDLVLDHIERGLIDLPLAEVLATLAEPVATPAPERGHCDAIRTSSLWLLAQGIDACTICGDAHRPTQCPEVAAHKSDPDPEPVPPPWEISDAGRAIARQWCRDRGRFLAVLRGLDRDAWRPLAECYAAYLSRTGSWHTPDHVLDVWAKAVDHTIALPPRAA